MDCDWLSRWNLYSPHATALHDAESGREITYRELHSISQRLASALHDRYRLQPGDRVAVLAHNEWEYVALFFATQRLGVALVPINFRLTAREIAHVVKDSDPALLIYQQQFAERLEGISTAHQLLFDIFDSDDGLVGLIKNHTAFTPMTSTQAQESSVVMILYTSGTTGAAKGAMITNKMLFWNSLSTGLRLNLQQSDVTLSFLPFFHTGAWNVLLTPFLHRGAKTILLKKFEPATVLKLAAREKITILFGVPTTLDLLTREPAFAQTDLSSLRYAIVGGEPMPRPLIQQWQARGVAIRQGYGLTEFGPNVFSLNAEDSERKMGSIGFANFYIDTKVIDDHGHKVGIGQVGELCLRGPACTPGYWRNPEATQQTIRAGWLHTGDLVRCDEDGYFFVVGRKKEMYISGGENVYPAEVEQVLRANPNVLEAAVIGVPDHKWGEVGKAFVVTKATISRDELHGFCTQQLAKFKVPKEFVFLKELPKGDSGKVLKRLLS